MTTWVLYLSSTKPIEKYHHLDQSQGYSTFKECQRQFFFFGLLISIVKIIACV